MTNATVDILMLAYSLGFATACIINSIMSDNGGSSSHD
jgi:hypothetical protein